MSRVIAAEDAPAAQPWGLPEIDAEARRTTARSGGGVVTAGILEDLQQEAWREAYAQGLEEGRAAGREEVRQQVERLDLLFTDLARPFQALDEDVQRELVALAVALARQLLRRELKQDPTQIIGIVREAIGELPVASRDVRVQLHPEDAAIVRAHLAPAEHERAWLLVEDPMMMRGGCQVLASTSRVDARLESRLGALLSDIMGGEREADARGVDPR
ncbi:MAG: flagellar assembly protein FliH [Steroidobacteraceae bacterium]|jgi:flagellar assembly protein FliH|nr:flagellar assembly protein FliH [Steroidobacteraceae bacterium]